MKKALPMKKALLALSVILFPLAADAASMTIIAEPIQIPAQNYAPLDVSPQPSIDPNQYNMIMDKALHDVKEMNSANLMIRNTQLNYLKPASGVMRNVDQYMNTTGIDDVNAAQMGGQ